MFKEVVFPFIIENEKIIKLKYKFAWKMKLKLKFLKINLKVKYAFRLLNLKNYK